MSEKDDKQSAEDVQSACQIKVSKIVRTNLSCPCVWEVQSEDGKSVKMTFRMGILKVFCDDKMILQDSKDDFDIGTYLDDDELVKLLKKHNLVCE
jgi:hypothetical protein